MSDYSGQERRRMDDNLALLMQSLKELFNEKFNTLEARLDRLESDNKKDLESIRAGMENLFHSADARSRTDILEVNGRLDKMEERIKKLEDAPATKALEERKSIFQTGKDMATKAFWTAALGFVGFLIYNYIVNGGK